MNQPQWQKDQERIRKQQEDLRRMQMGAQWMEQQKAQQQKQPADQLPGAPHSPQNIQPGSSTNPYLALEQQVDALRRQLAERQLTEEQVRARLSELVVQDAEGVTWTVGFETGSWYRRDGSSWVKTGPPRIQVFEQRAQGGWCGFLLVVGLCIVLVVFAIFFLESTGVVDL